MIPFLRLPAATACAAVFLLVSGSPAPAADAPATPEPSATVAPDAAERHAAAEELVAAMHLEKATDATGTRMVHSIDQITERMEKQPNATPEQVADAQKLREELHGIIEKGLGWESMKPEVVKSYEEGFTPAELKEISAFYHSPIGEKLAENQVALTDKFNKAVQQRTMAIVPMVQQKLRAASMKNRPAPVAPPMVAPGGAPAAGPGMSPAASVTTPPVPAGAAAPVPIPQPAAVAPVVPAPTPAAPSESTPKPATSPAP